MDKMITIAPFFLLYTVCSAQTEVYFKYDEAGNQRYRGPNSSGKQPVLELTEKKVEVMSTDTETEEQESLTEISAFNEKDFWAEIRIYPVPVKETLHLDWSEKVDGVITQVSLFQHNTIHWVFQHDNLPGKDNVIKIDMTGNPAGIYILTFVLKDGKKLSKNIIKN